VHGTKKVQDQKILGGWRSYIARMDIEELIEKIRQDTYLLREIALNGTRRKL
jgi:hypothetical protein